MVCALRVVHVTPSRSEVGIEVEVGVEVAAPLLLHTLKILGKGGTGNLSPAARALISQLSTAKSTHAYF
jgi:hypothetical protein